MKSEASKTLTFEKKIQNSRGKMIIPFDSRRSDSNIWIKEM